MAYQHFIYIIIDGLVIFFPFIFSFHKKFRFIKEWKHFLVSNSLVTLVFIIWDIVFTDKGIWWFNEKYTLGIKIYNLPLEEVLFFICIPYSCVFSYYVIEKYIKISKSISTIKAFYMLLMIGLILGLFIFPFRQYTYITFFLILFTLMAIVLSGYWLFLKKFLVTYFFIILFFILSNGTLTGGLFLEEPVVFYNPNHIIGWRVAGIPFEDFFYGMLLILWNILGFKLTKKLIS
ncbi:MAG: lycopene cyclase domain-containing protein [Bacteroidia bacterium]|nr:lycopene cyclase domain-containing protein [Bacteroidia bacterium]